RDKSRWVFFTPHTLDELHAYRETVPHEQTDPVWWGYIGREDQAPINYRGLYQVLRRLSARLDVPGQHNPHAFRHAFGKRMNKSGVSTLVLQELMGHSSPEVTKIYAGGLEPDELGGLYDRFNPFVQEAASAD
ncbi:MAG: site-specific integrase, partial [Anaerolineae bacterium]|nr:site-specific integrase [Anaerolineae bacterium]